MILGCGDSTPLVAQAPLSTTPTMPAAIPAVAISTHEVAQTVTVGSTRPDYATANCPQGEVALGGGWSVPSQNVRVFKALLTGNTWSVYVTFPGPVVNPGTAGASVVPPAGPLVMPAPVNVTVTAYVECLAGAPGAVVTQRPVEETVPPSSTTYDLFSATCNANEVAVGYSVDLSPSSANLELMATVPNSRMSACGR